MSRSRILLLCLMFVFALGATAACTPTDTTTTGDDAAEEADAGAADEESMDEESSDEDADDESSMDEDADDEESMDEDADDESSMDDDASGAMSVDDVQADPLGVIEVAEGDPIEIGAMFVLSGPNADLGEDSRDGVELAIADFGDLAGRSIELTTEDEQCTPEGGQTAATRIAANDAIVGAVGTSCSGAAEPAIPILDEAGMVLISPSNTAPALTAEDRPAEYAGYLRTAHNDLFQGRVAAEFAYNELGVRSAATIHDGSPYAEELQAVFAEVFQELGGEVTTQEAIQVNDTDMTPVLTSIAATAPEVIYYPIFTAEGGFITSQARDVEGLEDTVLMGADGLYSPSFVEAAGSAAEGMYLSGPYVSDSPLYEAFLEKLEETYGRGPLSGFHAHAYDATTMLLNAIAAASAVGDDGTLYIGRQAVRDALYATDGYEGLTGVLSCDETGDCATGEALAVFQIGAEEVQDPSANWPPEVVYP